MFFKRLSRGSRQNSVSYVDDYDHDERDFKHPYGDSPRQSTPQHNTLAGHPTPPATSAGAEKDMYQPRSQAPADPYSRAPHSGAPYSNGTGGIRGSTGRGHVPAPVPDDTSPSSAKDGMAAPDLLTRAFNEAVRPYQEKIDSLESQLADLQGWVEQLEKQRDEVHAWIDKRGLRPDVPPAIAKVLDNQQDSATTLNAQLDRKITIVNFDLHRLQDDLNDSISSSHFASAMTKFLPDITRLSGLPTGPRYAFDLILKLGGNLNSHGGLDTSDTEDLQARRDFYARLDNAMVEVVRRRFQENEDWPVSREIKRIEKTAAYLRNFGVEPYFPATLDAMRREVDFRGAGPAAQGVPPAAHSPPRYHQ